jgi:hypothetical protein
MTLDELRRLAVARAFRKSTSIAGAIRQLGYLQADPIRAPARAQDLILRHRVKNYRIDDLERKYPQLPVVEDMLHNYGFFPREHLSLLYPRTLSSRWDAFMDEHKPLRRKLLRYLNENAEAHPREVERALGSGARVNGWGGSSAATTLMLEALHREGRTEVSRRDSGIRVYRLAAPRGRAQPLNQRADDIVRMMVNLYAPLSQRSLMRLLYLMGPYKPEVDYDKRIDLMIRRGELVRQPVDGVIYLWPEGEVAPGSVDDSVKLLAPFDPLVWDRDRFEHLWGWAYRFEAYTPPAKRKMGYYALPLLWRDRVIGWGNVSAASGEVAVQIGYAAGKFTGGDKRMFNNSLKDELQALRSFLFS